MSVYAGYESIGDLPTRRRKRALCGLAVVGFILIIAATGTVVYLWLTTANSTPTNSLPQITQIAKKGARIGDDDSVRLIYSAQGCRVALLSFRSSTSDLVTLATSPDLGCKPNTAVMSLGVSTSGLDVVISIGTGLMHLKADTTSWTPLISPVPVTAAQSIGRVANAVKVNGHEIYFYVFNINTTQSAVGALNISNGFPELVDSIGMVPPSDLNGASDVVWDPQTHLVYVGYGDGLAVYSFNYTEFEFVTVIPTQTWGSDGIWLLSPYIFMAAGSAGGSRMLILDLQNETEVGSIALPPQFGWAGGVALRPEEKDLAVIAIDIGVLGVDVSNITAPSLLWACKLGERAKNYFGWNIDVTSDSLLLSDVAGGLQILSMKDTEPRTVAHFGAGALASCSYERL